MCICFFAALFALAFAQTSRAADWIDASGNEYTALKYIKGTATTGTTDGGWFVIDFKPTGNEIVKMRFQLANTGWTQFLWCNRPRLAPSTNSDFPRFGAYYDSTGGSIKVQRSTGETDGTANSTTGLYDTVTQKFYTKATYSGDFESEEWGNDRAGKKWTGAGSDNLMSNGENWEGGVAPAEGDDLDFTIAVPNAPINADTGLTYGTLYLGMGDLPAFTGSLSATAVDTVTQLARLQAYDTATASFEFSLAAPPPPSGEDFVWNGTGSNWGDADAWTYDSDSADWADGNNAIFNTPNATAAHCANAHGIMALPAGQPERKATKYTPRLPPRFTAQWGEIL